MAAQEHPRPDQPPLPPALRRLLPPPVPDGDAADVARLRAARPQWAADSLARLLVYSRLSQDFTYLHQPDSAYAYLRRAWPLASLAARTGRVAEQLVLARDLAYYYYARGATDSAQAYFRLTSRLFHATSFDSLDEAGPNQLLPTNHLWGPGWLLAGTLANAGSASRALGELPTALAYYERASSLYRRQRALSGLLWVQSLLGETYAAQDNYPQAVAAYEQALGTARRYARQQPISGSHALANLVLAYYAPLLLAHPGQGLRASQLAAEAAEVLQATYAPPRLRADPVTALVLAHLRLVPAQAALQAGKFRAAAAWLAQARSWLRYGRSPTVAAGAWDPPYARVQALALGLQAWQQHPTDPAGARRQLAEATALLGQGGPATPLYAEREQLARYCLAMGEPGPAAALLQPLLRHYQHPPIPLPLSAVTALLTQAYAGLGRYDSAYYYGQRTQRLVDTLRQARQFAALATAEAHFRTREQASRIALLTQLSQQQARYTGLALAGALLLGLLALWAVLAQRTTRRLNGQLATQAAQLQAQATRLGELDAAKNQFFANVSHELRTPLTLILGPLDSLLTASSRPLPATVRAPLSLALRQAQRLLELVNRILDLTKLQAGHLAARPVPTALAPLLRRILAQFGPLAAAGRVTLVGPAALPPDALCLALDADKLEQILTNLLSNALRHTPAGGAVTVSLALPTAPASDYVLTVRDTGPGIAAAEQARVFERYYQSPQGQAQGGTGLGLALSRELAQLLGGSLTLVSEPGQGAAFTLRFAALRLPDAPAAAGQATKALPHAPANAALDLLPPAGPRARVLVVENQAELREYLASLLAPSYEVVLAEDGQAALELLTQPTAVDLLVTDAMMPRLSGTELLARLRRVPAWQALPALMLTARADEAHRQLALTVGVDDYLTKPFVAAELLAHVRALLARQQVRRHFAALPPEDVPVLEARATPPVYRAAPVAPVPPAVPLLGDTGGSTGVALTPEQTAAELAQWQAKAVAELADPAFGPAELAALLLLSERTLYRRLGELAGLTPAAWLRELRLAQARQLLEAGGFGSVAEVAEATGFVNVRSFSQRYAERFGRRPTTYPI